MNEQQLAEFLSDWTAELQADNDAALAKMQEQEKQQKYEEAYDYYKEEGHTPNYCHEMALAQIGEKWWVSLKN